MSNNLITKKALADALKSLLQEMPLSKISVKSITTRSNISRNTFYYHFKDKYELIHWIFYSDMLKNVNSFNDPCKLAESFVNVCRCLYANRKFYLACFQYVGQNSLYDYLYGFYYELWKINIDVLYTESGFKLTEAELHIMAQMKSHALIGIISDWVDSGMHDDYMAYFNQVYSVLELESSSYSLLSNQKMNRASGTCTQEQDDRKKCTKAC